MLRIRDSKYAMICFQSTIAWGNKQEDKLFKKAFAKLRTMPKVFFQSKTSSSERAIRAPARAMSSRFARWISSVTEDVQSLRTVTS